MTAAIGVFGKHQGYGDFLAHRVDAGLVKWFEQWLDRVLPALRESAGTGWEVSWDAAPCIRFWIGRGIAGRTVAGVMGASRDKVGRRYPLFLLVAGAAQEAPVTDADQSLYERLETALSGIAPDDDIKEVVNGLSSCRAEDDAAAGQGPLIWAHQPDGDLATLLHAAGAEDARRAITGRSYWWAAARGAGEPAVWLGQNGLPDATMLAWLLFGQGRGGGTGHA